MNILPTMVYCVTRAVRHPRTPIRINNPGHTTSPIPWWGSIGVVIIGVTTWCVSAAFSIQGLDEAGRAMVYLPLGNIFGMSVKVRK